MRRPMNKKLKKRSKLPSVKKLWSVEEKLGGWDKAQTKFFSANVRQSLQQNVAVCGDLLQHADAQAVNQQACSAATPACYWCCNSTCYKLQLHDLAEAADPQLNWAQGILDSIQRHVGEVRLRQREEQKRRRR